MSDVERPWDVDRLRAVMRELQRGEPIPVAVGLPALPVADPPPAELGPAFSLFGVQVKVNPAIPPGYAVMQGVRGELVIMKPDGTTVHVPGWDDLLMRPRPAGEKRR